MEGVKPFDVIVVGAGPAGATTALALARAGVCVGVVEKARFPRRKVCGEFISETSWPLLQELGLDSCLRAQAGPRVRRVAVFVGEREVAATVASRAPNHGGRAIGRDLLDTALLGQAQALGATVLQRWTLSGIEDGGDDYACRLSRLRGDETLECRARLLIAAHGSWQSGVLPTQRFGRDAQDRDLFGFKAHFGASPLPPDLMPLFAFPGGYLETANGTTIAGSCSSLPYYPAMANLLSFVTALAAGDELSLVNKSVNGVDISSSSGTSTATAASSSGASGHDESECG